MNDDAADPTGHFQPHVFPVLPGVGRPIDAVADGDVAADEGLTRTGPDHVRIGGSDGQRADRGGRLIIEDRGPVDPAVHRLEDTTRGGPEIVDVRVSGNAGHRADPVAHRADMAPGQGLEHDRGQVIRALRRNLRGRVHTQGDDQQAKEQESESRTIRRGDAFNWHGHLHPQRERSTRKPAGTFGKQGENGMPEISDQFGGTSPFSRKGTPSVIQAGA